MSTPSWAWRAAVRISVLAALIAGCSVGGGIDTIQRNVDAVVQPSSSCTDAYGDNSSTDEIVDSVFGTPRINIVTGETVSYSEFAEVGLGAFDEAFGSDLRSAIEVDDDAVRARIREGFVQDVPAGGDARFAATACEYPEQWINLGYFPEETDTLRTTPHLLRAAGRRLCATRDGRYPLPAEEVFEKQISQSEEAGQDPVGYRAKVLEQFREIVGPDPAENPPTTAAFREELSLLEAMTPDEYAAHLEARRVVLWAAVEHQCPAFSALGFGEECDTLPLPQSQDILRMRVHSGEVGCDEAREAAGAYFNRVLESNFSIGTQGIATGTGWTCSHHERATEIESDFYVQFSCESGDRRVVLY